MPVIAGQRFEVDSCRPSGCFHDQTRVFFSKSVQQCVKAHDVLDFPNPFPIDDVSLLEILLRVITVLPIASHPLVFNQIIDLLEKPLPGFWQIQAEVGPAVCGLVPW